MGWVLVSTSGGSLRRYWIESAQLNPPLVQFDGDQFHHIFDVCRQEVGSKFEVLCDGEAFLVEVEQVEKKRARARIIESRKVPPLARPHLHVVLSISRYQVMDVVVEKLVEMGVASLHPVFSDFSFVRTANSFPQQKLDRWEKIVVSATQQCGRGELMKIFEPRSMLDVVQKINQSPGQMGLFSYEGTASQSINKFLVSRKSPSITDIWILVGSEGGFSTSEVEKLKGLGFESVTLGTQVLRVETACLTLVSVLKYEFDLMSV